MRFKRTPWELEMFLGVYPHVPFVTTHCALVICPPHSMDVVLHERILFWSFEIVLFKPT